ncbi:MAG: hypothetical protein DRI44_02480 [Chlamydiae bacterium]|nr:MAG: hypothetical protein DRI44_02480 [Chlamydiota bacterium]
MQFGKLIFIHGVWIVIAIALFLFWAFKHRHTLMHLFAEQEMLRQLTEHISLQKQKYKSALLVLTLLFIVFALIQPKWGYHWEKIQRRGIDIIVAVDVSRSMLAGDIKPNRLDRAKREILDLIQMMNGDRIGLIAFAGTAFVQCPLTLDYGACRMFIDELSPTLIPRGGTHIGEAIRKAVTSFEVDKKNNRALIIITDGEDHDSNAIEAAKLAAEKGIKIYCIGIGTPSGSPIRINGKGGKKVYLKDSKGQLVLSKLDENTLKRIALITGGAYIPASASGIELDKIYKERIARMNKSDLQSTRKKRYEPRFQWPLSLALLFLLMESLISDYKKS